jgi:pimeloyl-ACP methyl ester carboxylesterase
MAPPALEPVLVLTGTGLSAAFAQRAVAEAANSFRILQPAIVFPSHDDRDLSDVIVAEALAMLDGAGADAAHVVGVSYGGVPAQTLALRHRERVRSLVLAGTTAGGDRYRSPATAVRDFLRRLSRLPPEEGLWASVPYLYAAATCRRRAPLIGEDIARRLEDMVDPRVFGRQHASARAHDTSGHLGDISAPTLVLHGEQDRLVPPENGRLLAAGIRHARFAALPPAAHAMPTDSGAAGRELVSFLKTHSRPRRRPPRRHDGPAGHA